MDTETDTDITSYAEVCIDGTWRMADDVFPPDEWEAEEGYGASPEPFRDRNYALFGFLAGVRSPLFTALSEPRGLPGDVSPEVLLSHQDLGGSHESWYLLGELLAADYSVTAGLRDALGTEYFTALHIMRSLGSPDSVRVVFWFDQ